MEVAKCHCHWNGDMMMSAVVEVVGSSGREGGDEAQRTG